MNCPVPVHASCFRFLVGQKRDNGPTAESLWVWILLQQIPYHTLEDLFAGVMRM